MVFSCSFSILMEPWCRLKLRNWLANWWLFRELRNSLIGLPRRNEYFDWSSTITNALSIHLFQRFRSLRSLAELNISNSCNDKCNMKSKLAICMVINANTTFIFTIGTISNHTDLLNRSVSLKALTQLVFRIAFVAYNKQTYEWKSVNTIFGADIQSGFVRDIGGLSIAWEDFGSSLSRRVPILFLTSQ